MEIIEKEVRESFIRLVVLNDKERYEGLLLKSSGGNQDEKKD